MLPNDAVNTELNPISFTNPKANIHNKLGQSMPIVNHKIKLPINIPITFMALALKFSVAPIKREPNINNRAITITI